MVQDGPSAHSPCPSRFQLPDTTYALLPGCMMIRSTCFARCASKGKEAWTAAENRGRFDDCCAPRSRHSLACDLRGNGCWCRHRAARRSAAFQNPLRAQFTRHLILTRASYLGGPVLYVRGLFSSFERSDRFRVILARRNRGMRGACASANGGAACARLPLRSGGCAHG
jgi:hypothetical protein